MSEVTTVSTLLVSLLVRVIVAALGSMVSLFLTVALKRYSVGEDNGL